MANAIPAQHPAVVLRSHYRQLRTLLAIAMIAVVGLTAAVVILATNDDRDTGAVSATPVTAPTPTGSTDGREEGSRGIVRAQPPATRYDGGPEEGSRGALDFGAPSNSAPLTRYDGGPEEGTRGARSPGAPPSPVPVYRYDGGPGPIDSDGSRR
jgi:hypothetical protein